MVRRPSLATGHGKAWHHLGGTVGRVTPYAATTKGVVDRLEARGLVTARPDARDRRRRAIALTEKGRAAADAAVKVARQITRQTLMPLTATEQRSVIRLLRKLT